MKSRSSTRLLLGSLLWVSSFQYFVVQVIAARASMGPFSLRGNPISDLGNTACGMYDERFVCSPQHGLMNLSFVALGLTMVAGSLLLLKYYRLKHVGSLGFVCMAIAGFGTILVGFFPENSSMAWVHGSGAAMPFLIGNLGMVLVGSKLPGPKWLRNYSIFSGLLGLAALLFYINGVYFGLGNGGLERVVAYPQTIWLIVFGCFGWLKENHQR